MVPKHPQTITIKFKAGSTRMALSLYKVQSGTKPKPYPIKGQTKKTLKFKLTIWIFTSFFQHKGETPNFIEIPGVQANPPNCMHLWGPDLRGRSSAGNAYLRGQNEACEWVLGFHGSFVGLWLVMSGLCCAFLSLCYVGEFGGCSWPTLATL